jgi:TonB family protein
MKVVGKGKHARAMRRGSVAILHALVLAMVFAFSAPAHAAGDRSVVSRVPPVYPELAKRMRISGQVKVEATVDADGKVTAVKTVSGSKMLAPAAEDAVKKWKFESGAGTGTAEVDVTFSLGS